MTNAQIKYEMMSCRRKIKALSEEVSYEPNFMIRKNKLDEMMIYIDQLEEYEKMSKRNFFTKLKNKFEELKRKIGF